MTSTMDAVPSTKSNRHKVKNPHMFGDSGRSNPSNISVAVKGRVPKAAAGWIDIARRIVDRLMTDTNSVPRTRLICSVDWKNGDLGRLNDCTATPIRKSMTADATASWPYSVVKMRDLGIRIQPSTIALSAEATTATVIAIQYLLRIRDLWSRLRLTCANVDQLRPVISEMATVNIITAPVARSWFGPSPALPTSAGGKTAIEDSPASPSSEFHERATRVPRATMAARTATTTQALGFFGGLHQCPYGAATKSFAYRDPGRICCRYRHQRDGCNEPSRGRTFGDEESCVSVCVDLPLRGWGSDKNGEEEGSKGQTARRHCCQTKQRVEKRGGASRIGYPCSEIGFGTDKDRDCRNNYAGNED